MSETNTRRTRIHGPTQAMILMFLQKQEKGTGFLRKEVAEGIGLNSPSTRSGLDGLLKRGEIEKSRTKDAGPLAPYYWVLTEQGHAQDMSNRLADGTVRE